jgi:hypothetical protein
MAEHEAGMSISHRNSAVVQLAPPSEREASYLRRSPCVSSPELRRHCSRTADVGFAVAGSPRGGARSGAARVGGARPGEQERGSAGGRWPEMAGGRGGGRWADIGGAAQWRRMELAGLRRGALRAEVEARCGRWGAGGRRWGR